MLILSSREASAQAIAVDNTSSAVSPNANSLTWSHTIGTGPNRVLIVGVSRRSNTAVTGVTYGGTPLTRIGSQLAVRSGNGIEMWRLLAPPSGAANIVVTLQQPRSVVGGAVSFTGVSQSTPHGTFTSAGGDSGTASVNVTSATGEVVVDTVSANGQAISLTAGAGQTQRWNTGSGTTSSDTRGGGSTEPGAASVTASWTLTGAQEWAVGAVSLKPAAVPVVALVKSVSPAGSVPPGTDLTYTLNFSNTGSTAAASLVIVDPVPADTDFKVGSATSNLGSTGLTASITYSSDGGATWAYTPTGGAGGAPAGYDRLVTNVRWNFGGSLSQAAPNNVGSVGFTVRIR